ncbi:MAG TPA: type I-U CRISPR-associated RAMP protein Csb1/Cas7u [Bryobacteraceae bacterium]
MSTTTAAELSVRPLTLSDLQTAVAGGAAAFRCRRRLQPGGGEGDKVFPPTYMGAVYAVEQRRVAGRDQPVTCVLLDSVQSQANRMEQALQDALDTGEISVPLVEVDFSGIDLPEPVGKVTSLQAPHRLADAILRDSEYDGKRFRESDIAKAMNRATPLNATPIYALCPSALVFGMWDSTGPKGGLGAKFERAVVSEVIGIEAEFGVKTASRIDPIITKTKGIVLYHTRNGGWTLEESKAEIEKGKPVKLGKDGKVSEANLGNVTPGFGKYTKGAEGFDPIKSGSLEIDYAIRAGQDGFAIRNRSLSESQSAREGQIAPGGVTIKHAEQVTTLSLISLRRLRFPIGESKLDTAVDTAGRTALAALGLSAATLAFEAGMGLRSRCLLWPDAPMHWELLAAPGKPPEIFSLDSTGAKKLLADAVSEAERAGLVWRKERVTLKPSAELVKLVRLSQEQAIKQGAEED